MMSVNTNYTVPVHSKDQYWLSQIKYSMESGLETSKETETLSGTAQTWPKPMSDRWNIINLIAL